MKSSRMKIITSNVCAQLRMMTTTCSLPGNVRGLRMPRDWKLIAIAQLVDARPRVRLASGETNKSWQITRSVICISVREQSLATVVQDVCRALEHRFEKATGHAPISTHLEIVNA